MAGSEYHHGNGFRGRISSHLFTPSSVDEEDEEARHLVYVFCDDGKTSSKGKSRRRRYCSLCRHFHQETEYKEGFEKLFARKDKEVKPASNGRGRLDRSSEAIRGFSPTKDTRVSQELKLNTLSIEGLKMYKVESKIHASKEGNLTRNRLQLRKEEFGEKSKLSARNCKACEKQTEILKEKQESCKSNKKIIKVVVPPFV